MVEARQYRHRVLIERPTYSEPTGTGQRDVTWKAIKRIWSKIETLVGLELERARMIESTVTHRVQIRAQVGRDIRIDDRAVWGSRILFINGVVDPKNDGTEVFLFCTEEVL